MKEENARIRASLTIDERFGLLKTEIWFETASMRVFALGDMLANTENMARIARMMKAVGVMDWKCLDGALCRVVLDESDCVVAIKNIMSEETWICTGGNGDDGRRVL